MFLTSYIQCFQIFSRAQVKRSNENYNLTEWNIITALGSTFVNAYTKLSMRKVTSNENSQILSLLLYKLYFIHRLSVLLSDQYLHSEL